MPATRRRSAAMRFLVGPDAAYRPAARGARRRLLNREVWPMSHNVTEATFFAAAPAGMGGEILRVAEAGGLVARSTTAYDLHRRANGQSRQIIFCVNYGSPGVS